MTTILEAAEKCLGESHSTEKGLQDYVGIRLTGVSHKDLWLRTSEQIPISARQGKSTDLPTAVENEIAECILIMVDWGCFFRLLR